MDSERPHMVIGVDFGMTCTGVSYANLSIGSETVRWIQKWPGRGQANENKVPTVLVYPHNSQQPSSWGFLSETVTEQTSNDREYKEWFKTYLEPGRLRQKQVDDPEDAPQSMTEVQKWYEDYLRALYQHIEFKLSAELSGTNWQNARIEFLFSVPTTWTPHPTVENFRSIAQRAGFGSYPNHVLRIRLTEAEAAAVHTSTEASGIFRERDILLVCDAGGGTTDLSVLRVTDTQSDTLSLQQLDVVFGETIGSAAIDYAFEKLVLARLQQADRVASLGINLDETAWEMMKSKEFQNVKCEHGSPSDTPLFSVAIPRLSPAYSNRDAGIQNGEMTFAREDLQQNFDKQVHKMFRLIDAQLQSLQQKYPNEHVAHLVLSGGLGNSTYVQRRLRARYGGQQGVQHAGAMQVRIAPDPQLAVCKGMVADRVRKLKSGKAVLGWRCSRASYGTICRIKYNKKNPDHIGKKTERDSDNGKLYITKAVAWFIKKGEPVSEDKPIVHSFSRKITPGDPRRAFPTNIVVSHIDRQFLPYQMNDNAQILCEIESDLSAADEKKFKEKNKHFWNFGKHHFKVDYEIRVIIGPADIQFELWFDGQKLSKDKPIRVEWMETTAPPEPSAMMGPVDGVYVVPGSTNTFSKVWSNGGPRATVTAMA